jgi:hypothetical protein
MRETAPERGRWNCTNRSVAAIAVVLCLGLAAFWALTATQQAKAAQLNVILTTSLPGGPLVTAGAWRSGTITLGVDGSQPLAFVAVHPAQARVHGPPTRTATSPWSPSTSGTAAEAGSDQPRSAGTSTWRSFLAGTPAQTS